MTRPLRLALGALFAVAVTASIAALSRVPYDAGAGVGVPGAGDGALVRLSWRTRGELVRECRRLSEEEIEALPAHMRRSEICEGSVRPYRLRVSLDGRPVIDERVRGAGARHDRPLYVFHDLPVPPGAHRVSVDFAPEPRRGDEEKEEEEEEEDGEAERGEKEEEGGRERADARPAPRLELAASLRLNPRDIALITRDPRSGRLVVRLPESAAPRARP